MNNRQLLENPVTTEIIRNAFNSAANEMAESLFRSAYTPIIYEMKDCAVAIFNENLEALGQSLGVPLFLGNLEETIKVAIDYYGGIELINEGDVYILNDSYSTGTHLNDISVFSPIFYKGNLVGFTANRAHWLDVGSKDPSAPMDSTNIYQEGLRIGPLKIMDKGVLRKDLIDTICMNSRFPVNAKGDLNAQISACKTGEKRLIEIIERFGLETMRRATCDIFKQSEDMEKEILAKIPEGVYKAEGFLDNDGITDEPVHVKVKVIVKDKKMYIDLSGSSEMVKGSTNCGFAQTIAACRVAYKMIIQPDAPVTGGSFKALEVSAPKRTIFTAEEPAACSWYFSHLGLLIDLIIKSFENIIPEKLAGAHYGDSMVCYLSGVNPETGELFLYDEPTVGGWGGSISGDGQDCLINVTNGDFKNYPIEVFESHYPIKVNRYEIRPDSGGPGENRGGMGVIREYKTRLDETFLYLWFERSKNPAWGIRGGKAGKPPKVIVTDNEGNIQAKLLKTNGYRLEKNWKVTIYSGGGGGYGNPAKRKPEKILEDFKKGYITREHARDEYDVVITESGKIDYDAQSE